jgi:SRSO17 transposase
VTTHNDQPAAQRPSVDPEGWNAAFEALAARLDPYFTRHASRARLRRVLSGLVSGLPRVNCWTLAEHVGERTPGAIQHFFAQAVWDDSALRVALRGYVTETLVHPDAVLVLDETGDLKKGAATVGVQRQYTGTAGRIENAQVAVYTTYASPLGHAFIDNALYMPRPWIADQERRTAAGVPADLTFATKPAQALEMIEKALDAGVPASWVAADEVYGNDPKLRAALARRKTGYVLAVAKTHQIDTKAGKKKAIDLAVTLPDHAWNRISAGQGAKGERLYDWAIIETTDTVDDETLPGHHYLLLRRAISTGEHAFYRAHSARRAPLARFVRVAGIRWAVEDDFQSDKELAALDEHQVRRWTSWHRWTLLSMLAYAFLAVTTANARKTPSAPGLIPLTANEVRHLFVHLARPRPPVSEAFVLAWSRWRRRRQFTAQASHYRRQAAALQLN